MLKGKEYYKVYIVKDLHLLKVTSLLKILLLSLSSVSISTSVSFDGLLVTGLYTSTPVQSAPIPAPAAFGFGKSLSFCHYTLLIACSF